MLLNKPNNRRRVSGEFEGNPLYEKSHFHCNSTIGAQLAENAVFARLEREKTRSINLGICLVAAGVTFF